MAWSEKEFRLTCANSGTEHGISVALPMRYDQVESSPLVLVLDGAWMFGAVRDATRIMSMSGDAPEAVVVGVSFTDRSMGAYLRSRARWYTPTAWVPPEETGVRGVAAADCGHAATFQTFLRDQVLPRLESEYQLSDRWLVGHSFSALFGLRVMFTDSDLFDRYLLASPSIWWDERAILDVEATHAASDAELVGRLFLSSGELEGDQFGQAYRMTANVEHLVQTLEQRRHPGLAITYAELAGETHNSVIGPAISRGLRDLT